jgi:hypothetical protein
MKKIIQLTEAQLEKVIKRILLEQENSFSACFEREGLPTPEGCKGNDIPKCHSEIVDMLVAGKVDAVKVGRIAKCVNSGGTKFEKRF